MRTEPFIGSAAVAAGKIRKHELRTRFRVVFPDVYVAKDAELTLHQRATAAWLWSHRQGVIAGSTAAALHGAKWVDANAPVEIMWANARRPRGIRTSDSSLKPYEIGVYGEMRITTVARTAFDIGRCAGLGQAVANLDALGNATGLRAQDVLDVAEQHRGVRRIRQLRTALGLYDPGAESPKETWLRLLLIRHDFPRPRTQIPVLRTDGWSKYYLDMGWEERMLAVEYDGEHHRTDPVRYAYDIRRAEELAELGWTVIRIIKTDLERDVVRRLERVWSSRLL
jgi:very-short-patch-repair endonuclease